MFTLLALLTADAPDVPVETLAEKAQASFGADRGFRVEFETLPFKKDRSIILRWPGWTARLFPETGAKVADDTTGIARILGDMAPPELSTASRRVRAVFYDDPQEEYTDQMVELTRLLRELPGALVFDPRATTSSTSMAHAPS